MRATHNNAGIAANMDIKTVDDAEISSYADADAFLGTMVTRHLASNVHLRRVGGGIEVVLYATPVVVYYPDETFAVSNGGFNTPTTSRRVTQFTPDGYTFHHENKKLVLGVPGESTEGRRFPTERRSA